MAATSQWLRRHGLGRTAIHEAGHGALAIIEGGSFDEIVLQKTENLNACIRNLKCNKNALVRIYLAGIMAARMARHGWGELFFNTAHDDLGAVAAFAKEWNDTVNILEWHILVTEEHLKEKWGSVEKIAESLIRNRRVTYEEAVRLFEACQAANESRPLGKIGTSGWQPLIARILMKPQFTEAVT